MRRLMLSMTQQQFAEGLGVTFQQIQKYEKGVNRIGASRLARICELLMVPPSFFFDEPLPQESGDSGEMHNIESFFSTADGLTLAKAFSKISSKAKRRAIVALVQDVAGLDCRDPE